ncbi:MAG: SlyX family protein [Janthinobacterium lividum]
MPSSPSTSAFTSDAVPIESRLTELEIKSSFAEDLLDELNLLVFRQQEQIDRLLRQVHQMRQQMPEGRGTDGPGGTGAADARHELPPHY